jgi:hypothetical protein
LYIDATKEHWQMARHLTNGSFVSWTDIAPFMKTNGVYCLNKGTYTLGRIAESPVCSVHGVFTNWKYR